MRKFLIIDDFDLARLELVGMRQGANSQDIIHDEVDNKLPYLYRRGLHFPIPQCCTTSSRVCFAFSTLCVGVMLACSLLGPCLNFVEPAREKKKTISMPRRISCRVIKANFVGSYAVTSRLTNQFPNG